MLSRLYRQHNKFFSVGKILAARYAPAIFIKHHYHVPNGIANDNANSKNYYQHHTKGHKWNSQQRFAISLVLSGSAVIALKLLLSNQSPQVECAEEENKNENKRIFSRTEVSEKEVNAEWNLGYL